VRRQPRLPIPRRGRISPVGPVGRVQRHDTVRQVGAEGQHGRQGRHHAPVPQRRDGLGVGPAPDVVHGHEHPQPGQPAQLGEFVLAVLDRERRGDRPDPGRGQVGEGELDHVGQLDADDVARLDPGREQRPGQFIDGRVDLPPGQAPRLAAGEGRSVGSVAQRLGVRPGRGVTAQQRVPGVRRPPAAGVELRDLTGREQPPRPSARARRRGHGDVPAPPGSTTFLRNDTPATSRSPLSPSGGTATSTDTSRRAVTRRPRPARAGDAG
jgi:hypothetical protein